MVGLDFSVAFDRENHEDLISKLRQFGVGDPFLGILITFLTGRLQRIVSHYSEWRNVIYGVPQGIVLGPFAVHFVYP